MVTRIVECIGCNQVVAEIKLTALGVYVPALEKAVLGHFSSTKPSHHNYIASEKREQVDRANVLTTGLQEPVVSRG